MYKSVLVATDGSETAGEAVRVAVELAKTFGATLHVVSDIPVRLEGSPPRHGAERRLPGLGRHAQHRGHVARRHRFQRPGARHRDEDPRHLGYRRRPDRVDRRRPAGRADRRRQQGHEGPEADPRQRPERCRALRAVRCAHRQDDLRLATAGVANQKERTDLFRSLHQPGNPLRLPNAWDQGSARLFASLGALALATTSGGHAATLGRLDGSVAREEALAHAASVVEVTDLPCRRISRTVSPTRRREWPRRSSAPSLPASRAARSRTAPRQRRAHLRDRPCRESGSLAAAEAAHGSAGLVPHGAGREFPPPPARPAGHDRTPAGLRGGRRRRPLRARAPRGSRTSAKSSARSTVL